jgi:hypothetical protein
VSKQRANAGPPFRMSSMKPSLARSEPEMIDARSVMTTEPATQRLDRRRHRKSAPIRVVVAMSPDLFLVFASPVALQGHVDRKEAAQ